MVEEPLDPEADPVLRARGLRMSVGRHYTRFRGRVSEVCTIELWSFDEAAQAAAAGASLGRPAWWIQSDGALLLLAHGVRVERGVGTRHGLVPDCVAMAEAARQRAERR